MTQTKLPSGADQRKANAAPTPAEISLGMVLFNQERYAELEPIARDLTLRFPLHGFGWAMLGAALKRLGRLEEALAPMRQAAALRPEHPETHYNLAINLKEQGLLPEAETSYRRALRLKPDFAEAHNNLGNILLELGRLPEAETSCRRALQLKPDFADALFNLGNILRKLGRLTETEAEACYRRALDLKPDFADAHNNLGGILRGQGRLTEAETSYRRVLELKPQWADAHSNLGSVLEDLGRLAEAEASYRRAMGIEPQALSHAIHAHLILPVIPESSDVIASWRARYQAGIASLIESTRITDDLDDPGDKLLPTSFYLAYHNQDDRPVMESLYRLFRARFPGANATAPHVTGWLAPAARGQRIRVGFLSEFLAGHTIGKLYRGLVSQLDRSRIEVVVIHTPGAKQDSMRKAIDALADKFFTLPGGLAAQQQAVADEKLDVLFYPDIGMSASSYFLAYARLAPVQAVSWGHPDTTGLDTMDYFVSSSSIEPDDAVDHYTERLICLNRIPCYYEKPIAGAQAHDRKALGLPETGTLYGCPQTLFKFHPDFDAVLAAIAEGDPTGHIVFLEGNVPPWVGMLRTRWANTFPILLDRALFLPALPHDRFLALMAHIDVLLDPLYFGSGNSLYDGMRYGTPMVTWPGRFMRGRIVSGAYRQMGVADAPIAERIGDYAPLALALGADPERRQALRRASMIAAGRELYADMRAVREFEAFLEAATDAAGRGERLPSGWRPDIHAKEHP